MITHTHTPRSLVMCSALYCLPLPLSLSNVPPSPAAFCSCFTCTDTSCKRRRKQCPSCQRERFLLILVRDWLPVLSQGVGPMAALRLEELNPIEFQTLETNLTAPGLESTDCSLLQPNWWISHFGYICFLFLGYQTIVTELFRWWVTHQIIWDEIDEVVRYVYIMFLSSQCRGRGQREICHVT